MEEKEKQYIEKCMSIYKTTKEKGKKIQENYTFEIPDYILDEIIENETPKDKLIYFINLAKLNDRISEEQSEILKYDFVHKYK